MEKQKLLNDKTSQLIKTILVNSNTRLNGEVFKNIGCIIIICDNNNLEDYQAVSNFIDMEKFKETLERVTYKVINSTKQNKKIEGEKDASN